MTNQKPCVYLAFQLEQMMAFSTVLQNHSNPLQATILAVMFRSKDIYLCNRLVARRNHHLNPALLDIHKLSARNRHRRPRSIPRRTTISFSHADLAIENEERYQFAIYPGR
jgi:hypothetical protein